MKKMFLILSSISLLVASCKTVDFSHMGEYSEPGINSNLSEAEQYILDSYYDQQESIKTGKNVQVKIEKVYVEKPVFYPESQKDEVMEKLKGREAAKKSTQAAIQEPSKYTNGTMWYDFDEDFTYEIYCQPYRTTDIQLQPGEQVIEMPFLSENKVWEVGAGVSRVNNEDTQHFFLKPAYSGLTTSMIIITDMRIYHLLLKSYKDTYMTQVKWEYPGNMPFTMFNKKAEEAKVQAKKSADDVLKIDPRFLSFDYKMKYSKFRKPYWLPYRIYDDGAKTYIHMNETVLHMTTPVLFNKYRDKVNYSVSGSTIIIPELIEKITLRIGTKKIVIMKKNYKPTQEDKDLEHIANLEKEIQKQSDKEAKELMKIKQKTGLDLTKQSVTEESKSVIKAKEIKTPKKLHVTEHKGLHMNLENHGKDITDVPAQNITSTAIVE